MTEPILTTDDYYALLLILEVLPIADPFLTDLQSKLSDDERRQHGHRASHLSGPEFVREIERIEDLIQARVVPPVPLSAPAPEMDNRFTIGRQGKAVRADLAEFVQWASQRRDDVSVRSDGEAWAIGMLVEGIETLAHVVAAAPCSREPALSVCPHCELPAILPDVCTPEPSYSSGCTEPGFEEWWDQFGKALVFRMNPEQLALSAYGVGRHRQRDDARSLLASSPHLSDFNDRWNKKALGLSDSDVPSSSSSTPDPEQEVLNAHKALDEIGAPRQDGMGTLSLMGRCWALSNRWAEEHTSMGKRIEQLQSSAPAWPPFAPPSAEHGWPDGWPKAAPPPVTDEDWENAQPVADGAAAPSREPATTEQRFIVEAVADAVSGNPVSEFAESFPLVRAAVDLRQQLTTAEGCDGNCSCAVWKSRHEAAMALYRTMDAMKNVSEERDAALQRATDAEAHVAALRTALTRLRNEWAIEALSYDEIKASAGYTNLKRWLDAIAEADAALTTGDHL